MKVKGLKRETDSLLLNDSPKRFFTVVRFHGGLLNTHLNFTTMTALVTILVLAAIPATLYFGCLITDARCRPAWMRGTDEYYNEI